jgi:hypothetical protein
MARETKAAAVKTSSHTRREESPTLATLRCLRRPVAELGGDRCYLGAESLHDNCEDLLRNRDGTNSVRCVGLINVAWIPALDCPPREFWKFDRCEFETPSDGGRCTRRSRSWSALREQGLYAPNVAIGAQARSDQAASTRSRPSRTATRTTPGNADSALKCNGSTTVMSMGTGRSRNSFSTRTDAS